MPRNASLFCGFFVFIQFMPIFSRIIVIQTAKYREKDGFWVRLFISVSVNKTMLLNYLFLDIRLVLAAELVYPWGPTKHLFPIAHLML